jgi:Mg2+ and Co2+ transporter CorA
MPSVTPQWPRSKPMIRILAFNEKEIREMDGGKLDEVVNYPVAWIDVTGPTEVELRMIQKRFNLHPLTIEDVTHGGQGPKLDEYDDYLFSVVHSMKTQMEKSLSRRYISSSVIDG